MGDNKGETTKKQQHLSTSPNDPDQESTETTPPPPQVHQQPPGIVVSGSASFIPPPLYIPSGGTPVSLEQQQFEALNQKRPRYTTGQWKLLPSPSQQKQSQTRPHLLLILLGGSAPPPPARKPASLRVNKYFANSSERASMLAQFGNPMKCCGLARAWRVQYQGGSDGSGSSIEVAATAVGDVAAAAAATGRGKTRADKDKEVAEFLNRHGVNRDAKTAGTKWDNMLGEFRKVYEWERGGEREVGKSYFRLSPYERKLHRLPASFDEEVFEELAQFMGPRMRTPQSRGGVAVIPGGDDSRLPFTTCHKSLPQQPPTLREDDPLSARTKQMVVTSGVGEQPLYHGIRGSLLGLEGSSLEVAGPSSFSSSSKEPRRIGKIRMLWEESVNLWGEEGEHNMGRVKLQGTSFLNADELTFLDDSMVVCTMEAFEDGPLKGFSVDRFVSGQQVKVFGRRKSSLAPAPSGFNERTQLRSTELSVRSISPLEFQDPTEYYVGCLRVPPPALPSLFELSWHLQEPPPEELRFPVRKDVYRDLPQGKELFFATSTELLDSRAITYDILSPIMRPNPSLSGATSTCRDSFVGLWDDCINRIISKFCSIEMVFIRKSSSSLAETVQDQWPNVTGFLRNFCLWRGEETDQLREGHLDPSNSIVDKLLWTYMDLPYILGYYAVGYIVTFCALSRSQDRVIRTDLYTIDVSTPVERIKAIVPCWRIAGLLPLLADRCFNFMTCGNSYKVVPYSDFERIDLGDGNIMEMTPNTVNRLFSSKRKWAAVKEIYDFLDHRIPHAEFIIRSSEKDLAMVFKPRGCKFRPANCDQLIETLKHVTKALVALHDLSFMHRDLSWDKVMKRIDRENEWFVTGFDEAVGAPQLYPHGGAANGRHAPEMARGLHGVKVDVWGVGQLVKTCGLVGVPKLLRELQNRCLDHNPEQRPTAADCYHHLLQLQSSMSAATAGGY
ncbi:Protein kinase superfamily protein [Abeliophyllum distichum]|uniref:Protein kinase superfamily protein n=1 Tax=Abeliophyllum distichum TaxID=126358 RepID=A0ABD1UQ56_9LAMI